MKKPKFLNRYMNILGWLIKDSVLTHRAQVFKILASGFVGVSLQATAVGLVLFYIRGIENNQPIVYGNLVIENLVSLDVFIGFILAVFFLFLLSSLLVYYSKKTNVKFSRVYDEFCSSRLIEKYSQCIVVLDMESKQSAEQYVKKTGHSDARYCGRTARILTGAFIPSVTFLVAGTALFITNAVLTLMLSVVLLSSFVIYYRINIKGASHSIQMERNSPGMNAEKSKLIQQADEGTFFSLDWIRHAFATGNTRNYMDAYEGRIVNPEKSVFLSNILLMITILIVIVTLGSQALMTGRGWGELLLYVIALRYAMVNFNTLTKTVTSFNRFYPQFSRYKEFLDIMENDAVEIAPGIRNERTAVGLISPYSKDRATLSYLVKSLLTNPDDKKRGFSFAFISDKQRLDCTSVWDLFERDQAGQIEDLLARLHLNEAMPLFSKSDDNDDVPLTRLDQLYVILVYTLMNKHGLVIVDAGVVKALPKQTMDQLMVELQKQASVFIVYEPHEIDLAGKYEDQFVLFADSEQYAIRDKHWLTANRDDVRTMRSRPSIVPIKQAGMALDEEEDDE